MEPLAARFAAFGFAVEEIDGHSTAALFDRLSHLPLEKGKPTCLIANTVKGKGVSFAENQIAWHHGVPTKSNCNGREGTRRGGCMVNSSWESVLDNRAPMRECGGHEPPEFCLTATAAVASVRASAFSASSSQASVNGPLITLAEIEQIDRERILRAANEYLSQPPSP